MKKKKQRNALFNADHVVNKIRDHLIEDYANDSSRIVDPPSYEKFVSAQLDAATKKYRFTNSSCNTRDSAIFLFKDVARHMRSYNTAFVRPENVNLRGKDNTFQERCLRRARLYCEQILGTFDTEEFFSSCRHSSGTSLGLKYVDTSLSRKMEFPLTASVRAASLFQTYLLWDTDMRNMYQQKYPTWIFQRKDYSHFKLVEYSKLTTVPKNDKIDRCIAVEPTVNMFFQQGLGRMISNNLKVYGIDIQSQQDYHRRLAYLCSLSNNLSTIDFSSASDCVGIQLLKWLLPPDWFYVVDMIRSQAVFEPITSFGCELDCIATMGNATTFPLETLVFFVLGNAVIEETKNRFGGFALCEALTPSVTVFGDDVIINTEHATAFMALCESVGFKVNHDKSFFKDEYFRESCGGDFFHGRNVRGLYLKNPRSKRASVLKAWLYTCFNGILKKHIECFGTLNYVYRSTTLHYISSLIRLHFHSLEIVPDHFPDDSGVKIVDDFLRLKFLFEGLDFSIKKDVHGTLSFRYLCSVSINDEVRRVDEFHYWACLKFAVPTYRSFAPLNFNFANDAGGTFETLKKEGGYVSLTAVVSSGDLQAAEAENALQNAVSI